jgi:uncharacterized surface protein with fasciclin (FAS1) repeats
MKSKSKYLLTIAVALMALQSFMVSCSDDPGATNRFTTKSEYAADFLRNREKFSEFSEIVSRSKIMDLLGTYGSYTVFAPTNDAVDEYLHNRGLTSVSELSQADCDTITYNHIIEQAFFTTDFNDGTYPVMNMLERPLTITCDSDTVSIPGSVKLAIFINKTAHMSVMDDSVENGVVHTMDQVIGTSNDMLPDVLSKDSTSTLCSDALQIPPMADSHPRYVDEAYSVGSDSIDWTNDALVIHTAQEYDNVAYPEHRYFKFTAFVPQDKVFERYGVTDIESLKRFAAQVYDPVYPEDANIKDPTDRRNSLNRFISYHLIDRLGTYYGLTCVDGPNSTLAVNFSRRSWDIADWYETMMPYSVIKCSFPAGAETGLYINRRGVQSRADGRGYKIRGAKVAPASEVKVDQSAVNGVYHYIDDILCYGEYEAISPTGSTQRINTQQDVFSERMRIDCSTLSPDFMSSGARGHYTKTNYENGKYGTLDGTSNANNKQTCLGFKAGFVKNISYSNSTHLHVRPRTLSFWSYQGDEVTVKGRFDVTVKLPPVPAGDWEIRMFTCVGFNSRGIVQYYIDNIPQGIPFDMRPSGNAASIGWVQDSALGDEEQIAAFDKQFHNKGWMKGMKSYGNATSESGGTQGSLFRNLNNTLRKVIGTFHSDGRSNHYLRLEQKLESENNELNFDMIELCPATVYANPDIAEDRW